MSGTIISQWSGTKDFITQICYNVTNFSISGYSYSACATSYAKTENYTIQLYHPSVDYMIVGYSKTAMHKWIYELKNSHNFTCYVNFEDNTGITEIYPYIYWWATLFILSFISCCGSIVSYKKRKYDSVPPRYESISTHTSPPPYEAEDNEA